MSPSWHDQVRVGLCPDRILLATYQRGLRPRLAKSETATLDSPGRRPWSAALASLPQLITHAGLRHPQVTVVLSNHFVRYAVLAPNSALRNDSAWRALARHRFASVHGAAVEDWTIRLSGFSFGGVRVAAAMDSGLLDGLEQAIHEAGASFLSAQPYLMSAFNRVCGRVGAESCWLVVGEPGRLTLALLRDGAWHAVRTRRADAGWLSNLPEILERESAVAGLDQPCTQVVLYAEQSTDDGVLGGFRLRNLTLRPGASLADRTLAMVLA